VNKGRVRVYVAPAGISTRAGHVATPHQVPRDPLEARELVKRARHLERLQHRRRTLLRALSGVEATIRTERKFIADMTAPFVYAKPIDVNGATPPAPIAPARRRGRPRTVAR